MPSVRQGARNDKEEMPMGAIDGRTVAFMATDGVEQVELTEPWDAVEREGGRPVLLSNKDGEIQAVKGMDLADRFPVDGDVGSARADDFDALVLPGGVKNPDSLRMHRGAVDFVRSFIEAGKPVASICHAPWMLVEADAVRGLELTSYPSLRTDIRNAGGSWVDREVVVDRRIVTSRNPNDLPAFCQKTIEEISEGARDRS
jgi:protease I